jgi:hypothetical protein
VQEEEIKGGEENDYQSVCREWSRREWLLEVPYQCHSAGNFNAKVV